MLNAEAAGHLELLLKALAKMCTRPAPEEMCCHRQAE